MTQTNTQEVAFANDFLNNLVAPPEITAVYGKRRTGNPFFCIIGFEAQVQGTTKTIRGQCRISIFRTTENHIQYSADIADMTDESGLMEHIPECSSEKAFTNRTYRNQLSRLLHRLSEQVAAKFSDMWLHSPESIEELYVYVSAEELDY